MRKNNTTLSYLAIIFGILAAFLGYAFFAWTLVPHVQMNRYYEYLRKIGKRDYSEANAPGFAFMPYTYVQPELRNNFVYFLFRRDQGRPTRERLAVLPMAITKLEEVQRKDSTYSKFALTLAKANDVLALATKDEKQKQVYLLAADAQYKKALALRPDSQEIIYAYSLNLISQNKTREAITMLNRTIESEPRVREAHHYLSIAYFKQGEATYDLALENFEIVLGNDTEIAEKKRLQELLSPEEQEEVKRNEDVDREITFDIYKKLFAYYYKKKDIPHFLTVVRRLRYSDPTQAEIYENIEQYIIEKGTLPPITVNS